MAMAATLGRTMDNLKAPAATWMEGVKKYEYEKRRCVDEGLLQGQQLRLSIGQFQAQERVFDPLLQRFRDHRTEEKQRVLEERERVRHLNRAQDIEILRTQPFNILNHSSKLEALAPGQDPMRLGGHGTLGETKRTSHGKGGFPTTAVDYNIVSNLPMEIHHWGKADERPLLQEKSPRQRKVPVYNVHDFNIVTNKYLEEHQQKDARDQRLRLLEGTNKHMQRNRFDPVTQQFLDPRHEENMRVSDNARDVEVVLRAEAQLPPSYKGRESAFYGITSHVPHNKDMLKLWDAAEEERKERFRQRYLVEHNLHLQDLKADAIDDTRRLNKVAPERFDGPKHRGYDIIENKAYGPGPKCKPLVEALPRDRLTPWEKALERTEVQPIEGVFAQTLAPEGRRGGRSERRQLRESQSAQQLRPPATPHGGSDVASRRSRASNGSSMRRSESMGGLGLSRPAQMVASHSAPPAPPIPGLHLGSVFSKPSH